MVDIDFLSPGAGEIILTTHIEVVSRATAGYGVVDGNLLTATDPVSMDIDVAAGRVKIANVASDADADTATIGAASETLDRIDIIYRDTDGAVQVAPGTPAAYNDPKGLGNWHQYDSPVPPAIVPAGIILGAVYVAAAATSISDLAIWMFAGHVTDYVDIPIVTTVGSPGTDTDLPSEQAVREEIDALMPLSYLKTEIASPGLDTKVVSEKAVSGALAGKLDTSAIATTVGNPGTDTDLPSEQAVRELANLYSPMTLLTTRGDLIYRNETTWARLAKGAANTVLAMGANDPAWGTVTSLLDTLGTAAQGQIPYRNGTVWTFLDAAAAANYILISGGAGANPSWSTISALLATIGSTRGQILYYGESGWAVRSPGVANTIFISNGAGADPNYASPATVRDAMLATALTENVGIIYPTLSADGKYSGDVISGTAGATLAFGDVVYLASADSRWELAKADAVATSGGIIGVCVLAAASDGDTTTILTKGKIRADAAFPTLTVGDKVYLSDATAGDVVATAPSQAENHVVRILGHALTANEMRFDPDDTYLEYEAA